MIDEGQSGIKVLHFVLQDIQCCLDLACVNKILPLPLLETVPGSPVYCAGLMNFKDQCVPVIDLRIAVGLMREQRYSLTIPVLLCAHEEYLIGLIVDKILALREIDSQKIEIHEEFSADNCPFAGAITLEIGVSLLMNTEWLFALKWRPHQSDGSRS